MCVRSGTIRTLCEKVYEQIGPIYSASQLKMSSARSSCSTACNLLFLFCTQNKQNFKSHMAGTKKPVVSQIDRVFIKILSAVACAEPSAGLVETSARLANVIR